MRVRMQLGIVVCVAALPLFGVAVRAQEATPATDGPEVGPVRVVAILTGPDSINETHTRYRVDGTDLGHTFADDGAIYVVFGDTFGPAKSDWRSNVAAVITDDDPSDGLSFD